MTPLLRTSLLLAAPALLALGGCTTPATLPQKSGLSTTTLEMNSVRIVDRKLVESWYTPFTRREYGYGKVSIESMGMAPTPTGTQEIWVTFTNLTDYPQNLQVRARFFDKDKRPIEDYSAWKRVHMAPKGASTYKTMSLTPAAAYFYVEAKEAD